MGTIRNAVLLAIAILVGRTLRQNPMLIGQSVGASKLPSNETFPVYTSHPVMDAVLEYHKGAIDVTDYDKYRNHCLRVLSFAGYYYQSYIPKEHRKGVAPPEDVLNVMAVALAYHDIGLWTAKELDYLEPSVATLNQDWAKPDLVERLPAFSETDLETARIMILQHHKFTEWKPSAEQNPEIDQAAVNAVRRGDWADATLGLIKTGLPPSHLEQAYNLIPEAGFHAMLAGMTGRLSPDSMVGQLQVLKILKW